MGVLDGKVALINGASGTGTGRSCAIRFAAEGAKIAVSARSEEGLRETVKRVEAVGGTAIMLLCDLGDPDGGRATLVERTEKALGPIDILVNNAVTHGVKPVHEWTLPELEHHAQVNLWAPWLARAQAIPGMKARKRGWILNVSSFAAELPPGAQTRRAKDGSSLYGAMKGALNRITVSAAGELQEFGVAVNTMAPQMSIWKPGQKPPERTGREAAWLFTPDAIQEPVETMAEAALALCSGDPTVLTGRIAYTLQLLLELHRPVYDLTGKTLMEGWQPADLVAQIKGREAYNATGDWPNAYNFHRANTPYPKELQ
jgi:NAD(P)-dependent dehydrogenase (short-subunit alcohol dehydrogenase family)